MSEKDLNIEHIRYGNSWSLDLKKTLIKRIRTLKISSFDYCSAFMFIFDRALLLNVSLFLLRN